MKKDQNLPNKNVYSNNSSGKPLPNNTNNTRNRSPYNSSYRGRSPERRNTQNSSQNPYNRPNSRNNYSRSNSIKQVHQYDKSQNKQQLFMSDFEFKPIHKFFKITISSIKYLKNTNSDIISLHVYNNTPYQVTLPLGLLGYCETNATISLIHEVAYRVNNILQLLDICQFAILDEELSINNIISNEKRNTDYFTKAPYFKPTFNITNYTKKQQKFLTMFNFEHSQITQIEFDKLAKQLLKYSTVYATSKFDVGKSVHHYISR